MLSSTLGTETSGIASIALQSDAGGGAAALGIIFLLFFVVLPLIVAVLSIAGMWKTFEKAGEPGWAAIVPIYNMYVVVDIADREMLWFVLSVVVPFAYVVPLIDVAEKFGKGAGYGIGLFILAPIFWPLLGFGDAEFQGSVA